MSQLFPRILFSLTVVLLSAGSLLAQTPQIYKSTAPGGTNSTFLLGNAAYARKSQMIYPAGTLTGASAGTINRIYFRYGSTGIANGQTLTNFTVRLAQAPLTGFIPAATGYDFYPGLDTVLSAATYSIPTGTNGNWFAINLTTAFPFDPALSLIIETKFDSSSSGTFGTLGGNNTPVRKIISPDVNSLTGSGTSGTWQDFGFDLGAVTGTSHQVSAQALEIYPSPASGHIWVKPSGAASGNMKVQLINSLGVLVLRKEISASAGNPGFPLEVQHLESGIYFVTLETADRLQQGTLTVIH